MNRSRIHQQEYIHKQEYLKKDHHRKKIRSRTPEPKGRTTFTIFIQIPI